ncbi:MAG: hypothetical protein DMD60_14730 [Gemmatimonadetes bacterium]|nr:MAG: hypothetical protein DMD60_14730 [Gemmatimonadota bacterium]
MDRIGLSLAEAEPLLDNDIGRATAVLAQMPWAQRLDTIRRAALLNLPSTAGSAGSAGSWSDQRASGTAWRV